MKLLILLIPIWLAAVIGWVLNIVKLFGLFGGPIDVEFVLRLTGVVVAPLGAIAGYL